MLLITLVVLFIPLLSSFHWFLLLISAVYFSPLLLLLNIVAHYHGHLVHTTVVWPPVNAVTFYLWSSWWHLSCLTFAECRCLYFWSFTPIADQLPLVLLAISMVFLLTRLLPGFLWILLTISMVVFTFRLHLGALSKICGLLDIRVRTNVLGMLLGSTIVWSKFNTLYCLFFCEATFHNILKKRVFHVGYSAKF